MPSAGELASLGLAAANAGEDPLASSAAGEIRPIPNPTSSGAPALSCIFQQQCVGPGFLARPWIPTNSGKGGQQDSEVGVYKYV